MNRFWLHRDHIYEQGLSIGFGTFSIAHLLWLLFIAAFCWVTGSFYRSRSDSGRDRMRKSCGLAVVLLEYAKMIVMGLFQVNTLEFVPLHLCSVGGFAILVYAMWPGKRWLGQLFAYTFFPAAVLAVVFPSSSMYPLWNFYCLHTFVFHALIIAFFIWLLMAGEVKPDYKGLWFSFLFLLLFTIPIYCLDGQFHVNYMFIGMRSDVGILAAMWDTIVPRYGRLGFTAVLGLIMLVLCHILYGIYSLVNHLKSK